ncbi:MAG: sigma-70 family RNA polymerase sigma factor, partial [Geodermatophilaceae bacterium]|nr:sigma-70 family RNA polymerase sigma factor [Geodermatophilaceae bacterium]
MAFEDAGLTALVQRAALGDQSSWNTLVDRFTGLLWAVARSHRLDTVDAGDVVQTTWLRLVEKLDRIEDPERLGGWLATTARRECLAVLRRRQRE